MAMMYEDYIEKAERIARKIDELITFQQFKNSLDLLEELYNLSRQVNVDYDLRVKEKERARKKIWDAISKFYIRWIDSAIKVEEFFEIIQRIEQDKEDKKLPVRKYQEIRSYILKKLGDIGLMGDYWRYTFTREMEKIRMDEELKRVLESYISLQLKKSKSTLERVERYLFPFLEYLAKELGVEVLTLDDLSIDRAQTIPLNFVESYVGRIQEQNREIMRRKLQELEEWYRERAAKLESMLNKGIISRDMYKRRLRELEVEKRRQENKIRQKYTEVRYGSYNAIVNTLNPFRMFLLNNTGIRPFGKLEKIKHTKEYEEEIGTPRHYDELVKIFSMVRGKKPKKVPEIRWEALRLFATIQIQTAARPGQLYLIPADALLGEMETLREENDAFGDTCIGFPARAAVIKRLKFEGRPPATKPMPDYWYVTEDTYGEIVDFIDSQGFNGMQAPFKVLFGEELRNIQRLYSMVGMTPYDLRKTWATVVWRLTNERKILEEYGGWKKGEVGIERYVNLWSDEEALKTAEEFHTFIPETEANKIEKIREELLRERRRKEEVAVQAIPANLDEMINEAVKRTLLELLGEGEESRSLIEEIKRRLRL